MSKNNECGDCTLCCNLLPIGEIDKPASVLCGDCILNKGCNIYERRPQSCKDFKCEYLLSNMDEDLKPINCNVIFEKVTDTIYMGLVHHNHLDAWKSENVQVYARSLNKKGISIIISSFTRAPKYVLPAEGVNENEVMRLAMMELQKEK